MDNFQKKAVEIVLQYERKEGRKPNKLPIGGVYDIESSGRHIEVKSRNTERLSYVELYKSILEKWKLFPNYYIYYVYDKNKPKLKIIPPSKIFPNLEIHPTLRLYPKNFKDVKDIDVSDL